MVASRVLREKKALRLRLCPPRCRWGRCRGGRGRSGRSGGTWAIGRRRPGAGRGTRRTQRRGRRIRAGAEAGLRPRPPPRCCPVRCPPLHPAAQPPAREAPAPQPAACQRRRVCRAVAGRRGGRAKKRSHQPSAVFTRAALAAVCRHGRRLWGEGRGKVIPAPSPPGLEPRVRRRPRRPALWHRRCLSAVPSARGPSARSGRARSCEAGRGGQGHDATPDKRGTRQEQSATALRRRHIGAFSNVNVPFFVCLCHLGEASPRVSHGHGHARHDLGSLEHRQKAVLRGLLASPQRRNR